MASKASLGASGYAADRDWEEIGWQVFESGLGLTVFWHPSAIDGQVAVACEGTGCHSACHPVCPVVLASASSVLLSTGCRRRLLEPRGRVDIFPAAVTQDPGGDGSQDTPCVLLSLVHMSLVSLLPTVYPPLPPSQP